MSTPVEPTQEHLQCAFERLRGPDWPDTLHDLLQAVVRMGVVTSAARALARGERVEARGSAMPPASRTFEYPSRREGARPIPARRRTDTGPDLKSLAAGERPDQE